MVTIKKSIRILCAAVAMLALLCISGVAALGALLPQQFSVVRGSSLDLPYGVQAQLPAVAACLQSGANTTATLKWFGLFPIKQVSVNLVDQIHVIPCGTPFGIQLYTEGVMVVGMSDVDTAVGQHNPARAAGLKIGDVVLTANSRSLSSMSDLASVIESTGGRTLTLRVRRDGVDFDVRFSPAYSVSEQCYKAGIWVRDSCAGIGTLTFYNPDTMTFAGLGHAVCDVDTGQILPIGSGQAMRARIYSVRAGKSGVPGELCGGFEQGVLGSLTHNGVTGLYGVLQQRPTYAQPVAVAMRQQVRTGSAQILTTVDGVTPQYYSVEIERVRYNDPACRDMVIRITDSRLLQTTGGIVQGMSGSPIIQDGKLVGAVTHVLVDDPTKGYAIFAESMLETAQRVADEKALKEAA